MQHNRVFLAGDACHIFSPVGGQVMNCGFQDALDLAWKLGSYINGKTNINHLNTYSSDRLKAIHKLSSTIDSCTTLIADSCSRHALRAYFTPKLNNRSFYRNVLPQLFSGYLSDYSTNTSSLVGKHLPYICFTSNYPELLSTYDIPRLEHIAVIINKHSIINNKSLNLHKNPINFYTS